MLKGIDITQRIEFTFKSDTSDPKSVFILKPVPKAEFSGFVDINVENKTATLRKGSILQLLDCAVVEVKNYQLKDEVINTTDEGVRRKVFESLDGEPLNELVSEIMRMNKLGEVEKKN